MLSRYQKDTKAYKCRVAAGNEITCFNLLIKSLKFSLLFVLNRSVVAVS